MITKILRCNKLNKYRLRKLLPQTVAEKRTIAIPRFTSKSFVSLKMPATDFLLNGRMVSTAIREEKDYRLFFFTLQKRFIASVLRKA